MISMCATCISKIDVVRSLRKLTSILVVMNPEKTKKLLAKKSIDVNAEESAQTHVRRDSAVPWLFTVKE